MFPEPPGVAVSSLPPEPPPEAPGSPGASFSPDGLYVPPPPPYLTVIGPNTDGVPLLPLDDPG